MSALAPYAANTPTGPAKRPTAAWLGKIEEELLGPVDCRPWTTQAYLMAYGRWPEGEERPRTPELRAKAVLAAISPPALRGNLAALSRLAEAAADPQSTRGMLGLLVDAYPAGRPANLDVYLSSMLHDAMALRFPPIVVALACRELRRGSKFLPSVAEFVGACRDAESSVSSQLRVGERLLQLVHEAEELIATPEPTPAPQRDPVETMEGKVHA